MDFDLMKTRDPMVFNKPQIMKLDGYCFRTFETFQDSELNESPQHQLAAYTDNDECLIDCAEVEEDYDIKITKSGKYLLEIHAAKFFIPYIIGNKGLRKKQIEDSTRTTIKLPKLEKDNIIITGNAERDVASARNRIYMIILEQREKHHATHFISVRVFSTMIKENFEIFKTSILNGPIIRGMHPSIFQKPEKFHLTITTLVLLDEVEIEEAINTLHDCEQDVIRPLLDGVESPLLIQMHGVEIMNDDPTEVDVLYGKVKITPNKYHTTFQTMADKIADYFARRGFIRRQYESVKLHVTLINTLFRKNDSSQNNKESKRETFDASSILQKFKNFYFGEAELDFIHLSIRFGKADDSGDYYYEALTTVPFHRK